MYGHISRQMNHIDDIYTIKFDKLGENVDFISLITIEDKSGNVANIDSIQFDEHKNTFSIVHKTYGDLSIALHPRELTSIDVTVNKISDNEYRFENIYKNDTASYAWYIIDKSSGKVIDRYNYGSPDFLSYVFSDEISNEFLVKTYIKDKYGQRKSKIVADIAFVNGKFEDVSEQYPYLNLEYTGHTYSKLNNNTYKFTINYNYSWNSAIKWYIYKNGGYYTSFTNKNKADMEFTFDEPGNYTVIYYLTTTNGDKEYWNFEQIEIK